jgi:hypothetical protein
VLAPASPRPGTMRSPPSPPRNKLRVPRARGRELAQAKCRSVSGRRPADVDTGRRTVLRPLVFLWSLTRLCRCAEVDNDPKTLVTEECRKTVCAEAWANYLEVSAALLHARRRVLRQLTLDRNPVGWPPHTVRTGAAQPRVLRVVPTCAGGARAWGAGVHNNRASLGCSPRLPVAY